MSVGPNRRGWLRKFLRRAVLLTLVAVVLWLAAGLLVAYRLTRRPDALYAEPPPWPGFMEEHRIDTDDGEQLGAWFVDGFRHVVHGPRFEPPAVLLLHGYQGNRQALLAQARFLVTGGHPVLLITLRAHGDSTGRTNDFGYSARRDVVAGVGWLQRRLPGRKIVVLGTSQGAAAAAFAGGELGGRVSGYILECPYENLYTATRNRTELYLPPVLSEVGYAGLRLAAPVVLPGVEDISTADAVAAIPAAVPVLILAGGRDRYARVAEAENVLARVRAHGRLVVFPHGGHSRLYESDPDRYERLILSFIEEAAPGEVNRPVRLHLGGRQAKLESVGGKTAG